jgi:hypothetical protein
MQPSLRGCCNCRSGSIHQTLGRRDGDLEGSVEATSRPLSAGALCQMKTTIYQPHIASRIPKSRTRCRVARLKPVPGESRTSLCQHREFLSGKRLPRPETGAAFSATPADCARQRPRFPASAAAKLRKDKDYSESRTKAALCRTAWWSWQDSNSPPTDYDGPANVAPRGHLDGRDALLFPRGYPTGSN